MTAIFQTAIGVLFTQWLGAVLSGAHIDQNFDRKKEEDSRKERQNRLKDKENIRVCTKKKEEQEEKREAYKREIEEEKEEDPDYSESAKKTRRPNHTHENFNNKTVCLTWQHLICSHTCVVMLEPPNTEIFLSCRSAVLQVWERTDTW